MHTSLAIILRYFCSQSVNNQAITYAKDEIDAIIDYRGRD